MEKEWKIGQVGLVPDDEGKVYCVVSPDDGRIGFYEKLGRRGPLFFLNKEGGAAVRFIGRLGTKGTGSGSGGGSDFRPGRWQGCWIWDGKRYGYATAGAMTRFCPRNPLLRTGFTAEQQSAGPGGIREDRSLLRPRLRDLRAEGAGGTSRQLPAAGMGALPRAWEKFFARHPQSKSEHARREVARHVVLVSLDGGYQLKKKPKQWDELVAIYRETAKEMGLPESSPATVVTVQPGKYSQSEDWVKLD